MNLPSTKPDAHEVRETFGHFPSGVAAMAAVVDGHGHVLVASSFTVGVSLEPPLVMFSVQKSSSTWPLLASAGRLGVSILSQEHSNICRQLAGKDKSARFSGIATTTTELGAILIHDSSAWFECSVFDQHPAGDHDVVFLEIHGLQANPAASPLVFHGSRFRALAS